MNKLYVEELDLSSHPLYEDISSITLSLYNHPLYYNLKNLEQIQIYMFYQVWCVWDFMLLVKGIQAKLMPESSLWRPPVYPELSAYIYEILQTEETDVSFDGFSKASHFQTFLCAMKEANVDTTRISMFVDSISAGKAFEESLTASGINQEVSDFVRNTYQNSCSDLHITVAAFCLSREGIIPGMFNTLLENLAEKNRLGIFNWYLKRHIHLDSETHGPLSIRLFKTVVNNKTKLDEAMHAAKLALEARYKFMTYINEKIIEASK